MKLEEIIVLGNITKELSESKEKNPIGMTLALISKKITPYLEEFDAFRNKTIEDYGERDDKGEYVINNNSIAFTDPKKVAELWSKELSKEIDIELPTVDINSERKINGESIKLSVLLEESLNMSHILALLNLGILTE